MTIALDTTFGTFSGAAYSGGLTVTTAGNTAKTAGPNEVVVVVVSYESDSSTPPTISGITESSSTLTFSKVGYKKSTETSGETIEVWTAPATSQYNAAASSLTLTINWTSGASNIDDYAVLAFAVQGVASITSPLDSNSGLPASASNDGTSATPPTVTFSTSQADDLLIGISARARDTGGTVVPSDWTQIGSVGTEAGGLYQQLAAYYKSVNATQSSASFKDASTANDPSWTEMVLAFTADSLLLSGTWESTEATDTMSFDDPLQGVWASIELKDIMDIGYPELAGVWASTEATDAFSAAGYTTIPTTFDPTTAPPGVDFQNENLTVVNQEPAFNTSVGARSNTSYIGPVKVYAEFNVRLVAGPSGVGIIGTGVPFSTWAEPNPPGPGPAAGGAGIFAYENGTIWVNGIQQVNWAGVALGNANQDANVGVAIDLVNNLIWFRTNGGYWNGIAWGNPTTAPGGLNPDGQDSANGGYDISSVVGSPSSPIYLFAGLYGPYDTATMNAGATSFTYSAPSGFSAWDSTAAVAPALMLDGYATGGASEVSGDSYAPVTSCDVTLSTSQDNDVIVLGITTGGYYSATTVTGITDTAGLIWKRRNQRWQTGGAKASSTVVNQGVNIEIWWAHAPTPLSADVISVNTAGGNGSISVVAIGVEGANYTAPWDTHTQAGGYVDSIGNPYYFPPMSQLTTKATKALLIGVHGENSSVYDSGTTIDPWTYIASATGTEHNGNDTFASMVYQIVDEPQTGTNVLYGRPVSGSGNCFTSMSLMFDSIVAFGETGTANEIYWFWDPATCSGLISLSTTHELALNYSAVNYNLMVLVQVMIQSASGTGEVTSISEGQGLVTSAGFERRSRVVTATPNGTIATEIWWAWMPMETTRAYNDTLTINTTNTASGDVISGMVLGLGGTTGSYGLGDPFWDTNGSLPAVNSSGADSPPPNVTDMSTSALSTIVVAWTGNITEFEPGYTDPFISLVQNYPQTILPMMQLNGNAPNAYLGFEYMYSQNMLVSNETAEFILPSPGEPVGWLMIGDAIPVGPPQPPIGTWASTEHKDTFTHTGDYTFIGIASPGGWVGFTPIEVVWASTEHADEFTGAPAQAPYDSIGWLGWVPGHGTMAATDTPDHMLFDGWLLGFGGITGQIRAGEAPDRFGATDYATVTGTWASVEAKDRMADNGYLIPLPGPPVSLRKRNIMIVT